VGSFQDLDAYKLAVALADDLRATVAQWGSLDQWTVGLQLIRSAD
jgi:hypothetical protein